MPIYTQPTFKPPQGTQIDWTNGFCRGLVSFFPFNEGSGPIRDIAGPARATINLPTWGRSPDGPCLTQAATASSTVGVTLSGMPAAAEYTIDMRIMVPGTTDAYGSLFGVGASFGLWLLSSRKVDFLFGSDHISTAVLNVGQWYHIAASTTPAGGGVGRIYINGVLDTGFTGTTVFSDLSAYNTMFNDSTSETFIGSMSYLRAWNRILSDAEIARLATNPWQIFKPPQPYWLFKSSGVAGASASLAKTLAASTFVGVAGFTAPATMAVTLGADTFVGVAGFTAPATMAKTLAADTFVGIGAVAGATSAAAAITLGTDTFVAAANLTTGVSAAITLGADIFAGTGAVAGLATGSASFTLQSSTFVGSAIGSAIAITGSTLLTVTPVGIISGSTLLTCVPSFSGPDVIAAVETWWLGTPSVQALTSDGKLWFVEAPERVKLPYATFLLVSDVPEIWTTAYPFERVSLQFNLHAHRAIDARSLGKSIRAALKGAPLIVDGQLVCHCLPDGSSITVGEGLGDGGQDCWVAIETFDIPFTT